MTQQHLALLASLREQIRSGTKRYSDMCEAFARHVPPERLDDVAAAMDDEERRKFLVAARSFFGWAERQVVEGWPEDPNWAALGEWVYRQPFARRPWLPLTEIAAMAARSAYWTLFEYLIPHLARNPVDEVVDGLRGIQATRMLVNCAEELRPGLDVVVAVAREHDRCPEAFTKLNAWALGIRRSPYWPRPDEWPVPPESTWAPPAEGSNDPACPSCGALSSLPLVYGDVSFETHDRADRRELILAGGTTRRDAPTHQCRRCAKRFCDPVAAAKRTWDGDEVVIDEWVGRVITALGQPDAVVTNLTRVGSFLDTSARDGVAELIPGGPLLDFRANPDAVRANEKLLADASRALGLPTDEEEKITDVARRLREKSTTGS